MHPQISVIICTHNLNQDYLRRTLGGLKRQTLVNSRWELLLIDNASARPLSSEVDLTWHSNARHIREEELGLTPARLRGIRESSGELLVFVDDDNVLDEHYLVNVTSIATAHPLIGAFGGSIIAEFEEPPPKWAAPYRSEEPHV